LGLIIAGLRIIKPAYDFCLQTAPKINTRVLQSEMEKFVTGCFQALKPLSYDFKEVTQITEKYYGNTYTATLCIGEWLRERGVYQKYGSSIDRPEDFFNCIRRYGEYLKPHVRKPIKDVFANLVDLTKSLRPYNEILVKLEIPETEVFEHYCPYRGGDSTTVTITSMVVNAIGVRTSYPWDLLLFKSGEEEPEIRDITNQSKVSIYEDIISYMVDLYKRAEAEVSVTRKHNEEIMREMEQIVAPFKIAISL